jgi:hypothetical protein
MHPLQSLVLYIHFSASKQSKAIEDVFRPSVRPAIDRFIDRSWGIVPFQFG